ERALPLRTVEDVQRMVEHLASQPSTVGVIGGGFIGLEIAENLAHRGLKVTVIEALDQVLAPLDAEMAGAVVDEMERHGVAVRLGSSVTAVGASSVELASGEQVPAELVVVAIGVRPDVSLARGAGLEIGTRGGITVNEFNQASDPSIYALGDAAEKRDALDGSASLVPLANVANRHGRVVADHIMGREIREVPTIGTAIVKVFDLTIATTGWNEKRLRAAGRAVAVVHSHPAHHAGYYPGAESMTLKLIFDPESGRILGAQGVGLAGVDKRIDVIATALYAQLRAPELADLELAYAPPFGSAKDPVNMLGYMAENVLEGPCRPIQWSELAAWREAGALMIDVRTPEEFAEGTLPGAINIPLDELRDRVSELDGHRVVVTCRVGQRGHTGTMLLLDHGIDAVNLDGGYLTWRSSPAGRALHPVS
ncbi:MAG: FAD-dependent oxidoreductase, partial [Acidimicrobiaceae bacterium]|nr:FAD-dependent oxidoreductase [Acidimicrobiaceae bacterium]